MANHVYNHITVEGNDAVMQEWDKLFVKYGEKTERPSYHGDGTITVWEYGEIQKHPFFNGEYDEDDWYNWGCENVGAKWAHIEDADEYYVNICSAWSPVLPYVERLNDYLLQFDEDCSVKCQYEDEFRNFIGVYRGSSNEHYEVDGSELTEEFESKYKVDLSSDEFDWSDEHKDTGRCYDELFDDSVDEWFNSAWENV